MFAGLKKVVRRFRTSLSSQSFFAPFFFSSFFSTKSSSDDDKRKRRVAWDLAHLLLNLVLFGKCPSIDLHEKESNLFFWICGMQKTSLLAVEICLGV
jgi:hypothetical protein